MERSVQRSSAGSLKVVLKTERGSESQFHAHRVNDGKHVPANGYMLFS